MSQSADVLASRLVGAGLSAAEGEAKASLFAGALAALGPSTTDVRAWWVPGRIEFLGKHTDYAGGRSLLCATERGFAVVAIPRGDRRIRVHDACSGERADGELSADLVIPRDHWSNYPLTVCRRVARNFSGQLRGVDLAFASDLPSAAGLSSSSALIVATFLALDDANGLSERAEYGEAIRGAEDLAGYLGAVENGQSYRRLTGDHGVGTLGGSQDHTAILCARSGALVQYAFAPVRFEREVALPDEHIFVIAASGVAAAKTGSAREQYNRAAERAVAALRAWRSATGSAAPTLAAVLTEAPNVVERLHVAVERCSDSPFSPALVRDRVDQLRAELEIVQAAGDALARGDVGRLGALVDQSQANAERLLGNQVAETIELARSARELGAVAASAFGAGFGGSVYALVPTSEADVFRGRWVEQYSKAFPARAANASFFMTRAGPCALRG